MAKDESFDVVSELDMQEVDNAFQQTRKELSQRYDLKDSKASLELDRNLRRFTLLAPSEFIALQVRDVLNTKLIQRHVDLKALRWSAPEAASGMQVRYHGDMVEGINKELATRLSKQIRDLKLKKVRVQVEGEKLRVFSASRDELQSVITYLKDQDFGQPLQYVNYR
ncbi:MAG: YajQ family cyclic di-GMP-binding protein [Actinomycetia bacterium]|nr:YajQ family cyclic di-GMP-binding protein [Actinomycetes bacterium]